MQFSRGEVGIAHENFSRKLRGEKKRKGPQNRICKYAKMGEFSEQIPSPDITQIWLGWHGLGWHSLLGTWAPSGLGPRPSSQSPTLCLPLVTSATGHGIACLLRKSGRGLNLLQPPGPRVLTQPLQAPSGPGWGLGRLGYAPGFPGPSPVWLLHALQLLLTEFSFLYA